MDTSATPKGVDMTTKPVLLYDLETDGLLKDLTKIHCAVLRYAGTGEGYDLRRWETDELHLLEGHIRVAHNGIDFDDRAIKKVLDITLDPDTIRDTLVLSRLAWPDLKDRDLANMRKKAAPYRVPKKLIGSHGLEAWGYRLHEHKGTYDGGWEEFNNQMMRYCVQDVVVLEKLWNLIQTKDLPEQAVKLEHDFQRVIVEMMSNGVCYDQDAADKLERRLTIRLAEIDDELRKKIRPFLDMRLTPKRKEVRWKLTQFNAGSAAHRVRYFKEWYGWEPKEFTKTGGPKMDSNVLEALDYPEAELLAERAKTAKILGYLSTGKKTWRDCVEEDGRIHGYINHLGTVTSRCTHSHPNLGNIPARGDLGRECRKLFVPQKGWVMVGMDASGLELRCLANRLYDYDDGAYAKALVEGDIHTANQHAAGLATRDLSKKFIYMWLYGAGEEAIGKAVGTDKAGGGKLKKKFLDNTPGVAEWIKDVKAQAVRKGYVISLDGRRVPIPSKKNDEGEWELMDYVAPNYQLQSDGAVIMKQAAVIAARKVKDEGIECRLVLSVHDELQYECHPDQVPDLCYYLCWSMQEAGVVLGLNVPLEGEAKHGKNWSETH